MKIAYMLSFAANWRKKPSRGAALVRLIVGLAIAAVLGAPAAARADVNPSMYGKDIAISIRGMIKTDEDQWFRETYWRYGAKWVVLQNDGGNLEAALDIGRFIRAQRINTVAIGECRSACVYIFMAGIERVIEPKGKLMAHTPTLSHRAEADRFLAFQYGLKTYKIADDYVREMGLSSSVTSFIINTDRSDLWRIENATVLSMGLATREVKKTSLALKIWDRK